jgi:uncharacterized cupin superfamily protein
MEMADKPVVNIAEAPLRESRHGDRFQAKLARIGPAIGLTALGCTLHVVPPGKRAYPFHAHHVADELFFILSGEGEYRFGAETFHVRPGDVLGAPAGKTAHQLVNTGAAELRYLGLSTNGGFDVVEYPDSRKFAVAAGVRNGDFRTATFAHIARADKSLDYWDGEPS